MIWANYFVSSVRAFATQGHINADDLRNIIAKHEGGEAYHCAYDLEPREDFSNYQGLMRPALGYVWFDFDSHDGGLQALEDTRRFLDELGIPDAFICYSGSKGFHVGVPFGYFGLQPSTDLCVKLNLLAQRFKKEYPTLDTTIYNANRKFRALGSKHPKTGLYKIQFSLHQIRMLRLDQIQSKAKTRGSLEIPFPTLRSPLPLFYVEQLAARRDDNSEQTSTFDNSTALNPPKRSKAPKRDWTAPAGTAAFNQCGFLQFVKDKPAQINEPQWYAALSIVSRFQDGRKQCHEISHAHPGYSVAECNKKIDQALEESAPRTCQNVSTLWGGCGLCPLQGKINSPVNLMERRFWNVDKNDKITIPQYNELLEHFIKQFPYKTIADMKAIYVFKETHYVEYTPIEIKGFAESEIKPSPQEKHRQEFYHKILANEIDRRSFFIDTTQNRINFKNGILELSESGSRNPLLRSHSPEIGFRHVLPYEYDPSARCETFNWWIRDCMLGDEDLVKILQEFMGYVIRGGDYKYHKALWLSGSGRNGKSTFLSVLKALIGTGNYSTLSIRQIISDKFSSADLDGKIANFSEETSPEELSDSGPFKNLTGDGELLAQKKYGDPYSFRNRAKLIMTYNEIPILKDLSPGMLSRPIIIPWKKDLLDESAQDKDLLAKLFAELPGIFNFALEGWNRLEAQRVFTSSPKSLLSLQEIQSASCSATRWVEEQVFFLPGDSGRTYDARGLYTAYKSWYDGSGGQAMGEMKFLKRINAHRDIQKRSRLSQKGKEYFGMTIGDKNHFDSEY